MATWDSVKNLLNEQEQVILTIKVSSPAAWRGDVTNIAKHLGVDVNQIINANADLFDQGMSFVQNNRDYVPIIVKGSGGTGPGPGPDPEPGEGGPFNIENNISPLPAGSYYISQQYGNGGHGGTDLAAGMGTNIMAVNDGTVARVQIWNGSTENDQSWGNMVIINHGQTDGTVYYTLYAHMNSAPIVNVGDSVKKGQVIGYVGTTGESSGYHLHIEVWKGGYSTAYRTNPANYIPL